MTIKTLITGFPRIGEKRDLKKALERYWNGQSSIDDLQFTASEIRKQNWLYQKNKGIDLISCNDFSYYDIMLDTIVMLDAIPKRFRNIADANERYFAMARGNNVTAAMEMTKWFNTNYHYIVPELDETMEFKLNADKIFKEYSEANGLGLRPKINIVGPLTFLGLSKDIAGNDTYAYFDKIILVYQKLLQMLAGLDTPLNIQIDEPILVRDPSEKQLELLKTAYSLLASVSNKIKIIVTTYFEHSKEATLVLTETPIWGIGLDFVYGKKNIESIGNLKGKKLVAGVVDGRNIWINDIYTTQKLLNQIAETVPREDIIVSTSCSLLHVPYTLKNETNRTIANWLSFACEKVEEVAVLGKLVHDETLTVTERDFVEQNRMVVNLREISTIIHDDNVRERIKNITKKERDDTFENRITVQKENLNLPVLPTTTIGSFPQTDEIRKIRNDFKKGVISSETYDCGIKKYIDECVAFQEKIGLDVLVHGEPERNDMVEYFGEMLNGFHFTSNGWVQSYGSRCVKPPIIYGDISRPRPMTVKWISYAQSKTKKIMKGMLTGPVTILNWSFVRNDMPRSKVSQQIAIALSDEITDLQSAGIKIIQVDEAAFKEGYPIRKADIPEYERWAVDNFKLAVSVAKKETQIHTHMCYSEFNDIIKTIEAMDADVITIETARSGNELLTIFKEIGYKNEVGPGVYDIHSPRVPSIEEFSEQINARIKVLPINQLWVNPDCGLKTRKWEEVKPALTNMVEAVKIIRPV
jgi:5-methyltetrahydropteroyltriglutamate--homocysteine methyltransferase